jgi:hypothetical protein
MGRARGEVLIGIGPALAIARLCVREACARPFLPAVAAVLAAFILALPRLVLFGFGEEARIAQAMGLSTLRMAGLLLALVFVAGAGEPRASRALLLARPVRPTALVIGRTLGALVLLFALIASLSVALAVALKGLPWEAAVRAALEGAALLPLAAAAAEALPAGAAAIATFLAFAAGHVGLGGPLRALFPDLAAIGPLAPAGRALPLGAAAALAALSGLAWLSLAAAISELREPGAVGAAPS